jgi:hypothetical protein
MQVRTSSCSRGRKFFVYRGSRLQPRLDLPYVLIIIIDPFWLEPECHVMTHQKSLMISSIV